MDTLPKVESRQTNINININVMFSLTVLPNEPTLLRRARRLVGSEADARDLVQETLERALRTFHAFRPGTAVWAWLRTIMNSVWIDGWRRRQTAAKLVCLPVAEMAAPEPECSNDDGVDADDEVLLERLPEAITRLPPIFREVLELRLQGNCSYGAIAQRLGIPSRTVGTRILRARRQLRAILEEMAEAPCEAKRQAPRSPAGESDISHAARDARGACRERDRQDRSACLDRVERPGAGGGVAEKSAAWHRAGL
jgi:RNA polymerase sigma-70 factor (ECF subfamily)